MRAVLLDGAKRENDPDQAVALRRQRDHGNDRVTLSLLAGSVVSQGPDPPRRRVSVEDIHEEARRGD